MQRRKVRDQQRVDGLLVPACLVRLPAVVPKTCIQMSGVAGAILKGSGEERRSEGEGGLPEDVPTCWKSRDLLLSIQLPYSWRIHEFNEFAQKC